jgi:hypothetical protein
MESGRHQITIETLRGQGLARAMFSFGRRGLLAARRDRRAR